MTKPIPTMTTAAEIKKDVYGRRRRDLGRDELPDYAKALVAQGHKLIEQSMADRQKWDEFWMPVGSWFKRLFTGDLFKEAAKP
jgi:hypothetical protein